MVPNANTVQVTARADVESHTVEANDVPNAPRAPKVRCLDPHASAYKEGLDCLDQAEVATLDDILPRSGSQWSPEELKVAELAWFMTHAMPFLTAVARKEAAASGYSELARNRSTFGDQCAAAYLNRSIDPALNANSASVKKSLLLWDVAEVKHRQETLRSTVATWVRGPWSAKLEEQQGPGRDSDEATLTIHYRGGFIGYVGRCIAKLKRQEPQVELVVTESQLSSMDVLLQSKVNTALKSCTLLQWTTYVASELFDWTFQEMAKSVQSGSPSNRDTLNRIAKDLQMDPVELQGVWSRGTANSLQKSAADARRVVNRVVERARAADERIAEQMRLHMKEAF